MEPCNVYNSFRKIKKIRNNIIDEDDIYMNLKYKNTVGVGLDRPDINKNI